MKNITIRQISNGFIVNVNGGTPASNGSNERYVATLEELGAVLAEVFIPAA